MLKTQKSQRGITTISILMILALCGFILLIIIKLAPIYLEQFQISAALHGLIKDARVEGASDRDVKTLILKKLQVDNVSIIKSNDIDIKKISSGKRSVSINYEARVNVMGNVDAVVVFNDNNVEIGY